MDVKVIVNGQEFRVGYQFVKMLANTINCTKRKNYLLARELAKCGHPYVLIPLIEGDKLLPEDYDSLWRLGERNIRLALLKNSTFLENASQDIIQDVLVAGDEELLLRLTRNITTLNGIWQTFEGIEGLSDAGWHLLRFIKYHHLQSVRRVYAKVGWLPNGLFMNFEEARRVGVPLRELPLENLSSMDIQLINLADRAECLWFASRIGKIRNKEAIRAVALKLAQHPDPQIRLRLAKNIRTPNYILKLMLKRPNEDNDIVIAASNTLYKKRLKKFHHAQNLKR